MIGGKAVAVTRVCRRFGAALWRRARHCQVCPGMMLRKVEQQAPESDEVLAIVIGPMVQKLTGIVTRAAPGPGHVYQLAYCCRPREVLR